MIGADQASDILEKVKQPAFWTSLALVANSQLDL